MKLVAVHKGWHEWERLNVCYTSLHPVNYVSFGMDLKTLCCGKICLFEAGTKASVWFALLQPTEKHLNERRLSFSSRGVTVCVKHCAGKRGLIQ